MLVRHHWLIYLFISPCLLISVAPLLTFSIIFPFSATTLWPALQTTLLPRHIRYYLQLRDDTMSASPSGTESELPTSPTRRDPNRNPTGKNQHKDCREFSAGNHIRTSFITHAYSLCFRQGSERAHFGLSLWGYGTKGHQSQTRKAWNQDEVCIVAFLVLYRLLTLIICNSPTTVQRRLTTLGLAVTQGKSDNLSEEEKRELIWWFRAPGRYRRYQSKGMCKSRAISRAIRKERHIRVSSYVVHESFYSFECLLWIH